MPYFQLIKYTLESYLFGILWLALTVGTIRILYNIGKTDDGVSFFQLLINILELIFFGILRLLLVVVSMWAFYNKVLLIM